MVQGALAGTRGGRAPSKLLLAAALPAAACSILLGLVLLFVGGNAAHLVGYVLSCVVPFLLVAVHRREAAHLLATVGIVRPRSERIFASLLIVAGLVLAALHAWAFAWAIS
jgi:hypothetical protein